MASKGKSLPEMTPHRPSAADADQWVRGGSTTTPTTEPPAAGVQTPPPQREPTRRLTLDLPERLHRKMKIRSATTGVPMVDEVRSVLEEHYRDDG
ncbi:hypothetical protein [Mycolicibacterium sp. 120270]|uniref:hypothetical protein n=1 Tax=Mycolicibacterium sp. 120270 TaxID=3090600 RepID=UPI00299D9EE4|nr:hypothetical protein [Mycolicibacterium sp. 120270]MDX1887910.1 hypothetical protein [Mycolicibacterium sp. 120270]